MNSMIADLQKDDLTFRPRNIIKNRHLQSVMASLRLLVPPHRTILSNSKELIIETSEGSKLLSYFTPHPRSRGLIIILHGWEGSATSAYVLAACVHFYRRCFSVCRMNLRDHGESHHLNEGLFHGALLQETFDTVKAIANISQNLPVYLLGFSLGANFSLRIAVEHSRSPIANLRHVFAVSPPLDPYKTTLAIDNGPDFYRAYFLKKWRRSLKKKQQLFPHKYDFTQMLRLNTCLALTEQIMIYYPEFPSFRDYFNLYTLRRETFQSLKVPVNIFIAEDDPVIPIDDFNDISGHPLLTVSRQSFGGHCGFIDLFPYRRWYNDQISKVLDEKD